MKHYIVIIKTSYSEEDYLVPVSEDEDIELATDKALSNICFCDDWEIVTYREVSKEYLKFLEDIKEEYLKINGYSVEESFTSGKYTTYENILEDIQCTQKNLPFKKNDMLAYIITYAENLEWEERNVKEQIRSLFVSWCILNHIEVDTKLCDDALIQIYCKLSLHNIIEYDAFVEFMVEFIV